MDKFLVSTNQRMSPYFRGTYDNIQIKVNIYHKNRSFYNSGVPIELWLNYSGGTWFKAESLVTNNIGNLSFYHSCINVGDVDCCLGQVKMIYDSYTYTSNIVRLNFISDIAYTKVYDIDGGTCDVQITPLDRLNYNIFDGGINDPLRENFIIIDRMFEE